jgi:hypothetical protein
VIPIQPQPAPADFGTKVQAKGQKFLQKATQPISWKNREYWRNSLPDLYAAFDCVCAYSAHWIPYTVGTPTVDHFIPKSVAPELAYDWANFRLSSLRMNSNKRDFQDVLDPFLIQSGWFVLDFPSLLLKPNPALADEIKDSITITIQRLKLNSDDNCVQHRQEWLMGYCQQVFTLEHLRKMAPFTAFELERQKLLAKIATVMLCE